MSQRRSILRFAAAAAIVEILWLSLHKLNHSNFANELTRHSAFQFIAHKEVNVLHADVNFYLHIRVYLYKSHRLKPLGIAK